MTSGASKTCFSLRTCILMPPTRDPLCAGGRAPSVLRPRGAEPIVASALQTALGRAAGRRIAMHVLLPKQVSVSRSHYAALPGSASNAAAMRSVTGPSLPLGNASRPVGAVTASVVPVSG